MLFRSLYYKYMVNKNGMLYMEVSACIGQPFCSNHVFIIQIGLCEYDFF